MKKLIVVVLLTLVSTTAQAKVHEVKFGGRTARIEIPAGCKKFSCIRVNAKEKVTRSRRSSETTDSTPSAAPVAAAAATAAIAPQAVQASAAPQAPARAEPQVQQTQQTQSLDDRKAMARLALPGQTADEVKPAPAASASPVAPAPDAESQKSGAPSPVGLWLTQKKEAKIRVVECGGNICGHVEGKPAEKVLLNMKPAGGNRWNGTIHDIRRGGNYSAHISLKGPDALKVTGCAFGGMFCGGETWTRAQ